MIVEHTKAYVFHLNLAGREIEGGGREQNEEIRILPGANVIPDDKSERFLASPKIKELMGSRPPILKVLLRPGKEGVERAEGDSDLQAAAKEIAAKSADEASGLIHTLADINLIREIRSVEDRKVVLDAVDARIRDLTEHRKDGK